MPDTGFQDPTANGGKYTGQWSDPTNAYSSDNAYCTRTENADASNSHSFETFGFSIPAGATITGVEATIEWKGATSGDPPDTDFQVYYYINSASGWSSAKALSWRTTEGTDTAGGAADLWGGSPTVDDFSDANFSFRIRSRGNTNPDTITFSVDHIQVKIHYTVGTDARFFTVF